MLPAQLEISEEHWLYAQRRVINWNQSVIGLVSSICFLPQALVPSHGMNHARRLSSSTPT